MPGNKTFQHLYKVKSYALILMSLSFFISCIGPRKMNKWIASEYEEPVVINKPKYEYISVTSPLINDDTKASTSIKKTKTFLPLIFYWKIDYEVSARLNPKIPVNIFSTAFATYANSKGLRQKLNGARLELSIDKIPIAFSFNDDDQVIVPIFFTINIEKVYLLPEDRDFIVSYKITKDNARIKSGLVNIADPNKTQKVRFLETVKKATKEYLSQYEENIHALAKSTADQIIATL